MSYQKSTGTYRSSDGVTEVCYYRYLPEENPTAILQISHGMGEYIERYEREGFISAMTEQGFVVCGNDHIGHGGSVAPENPKGHFTDYRNITEDMHALNAIMRKTYPRLPYVLLGHGTGELLVRYYVTMYQDVDGAILCDTVATSRPLAITKLLCTLMTASGRASLSSPMLHKRCVMFRNRRFSAERDDYSLFSARAAVRNSYQNDTRICFPLTASSYKELHGLAEFVSRDSWAASVPQSLPILLLSAEDDAVGGNGEAILDIYTLLEDRELCNLQKKQYPSGRHELLNDESRETVFADIVAWIREVVDGVVTCRSFEGFPFGRPV